MPEHDADLLDEAQSFADQIADLLQSTIADGAPIRADWRGDRIVVAALDEDGGTVLLPLSIGGHPVARLRVQYECAWDREEKYLAIVESRFALLANVIAEPILRIEYLRREGRPGRAAHLHVHGECTQLGALYAAAGVVNGANLQRLHLPVGGTRFRPCLEDVVEFLVQDLGVDAQTGWEQHVRAGREHWYGHQLASAMRKYEDEAVEILRRSGYTVLPPA